MRRFFLSCQEFDSPEVSLDEKISHHLKNVLRLKSGAEILLQNGRGLVCRCRIEIVGSKQLKAVVLQKWHEMEAAFPIHLIQAVPKAEKMEWLLQKGTELGIREFSPVLTGRTVPALQGERSRTRLMRWRRIVEEAARQCQRPWLPIVHEARTLAEVLSSCREALRLVCWEEESRPLAALLSGQTPVDAAVCIGPEGGFEKNEIRQLEDADFQAVSLGPRILRTETAGLAVAAIFQYLYGDMGSTIKNWILT